MSIAYNETPLETETSPTSAGQTQLTIADGLYLLPLILAGVLRLVNLDAIPLSPAEASNALSAWQLWQPTTVTTSATSSAYVSLTGLLIPVLGSTDAVARLIPALAGIGLVLLPWLMRRWLGTVGTLVAGLLLAVSPTVVLAGRTADGTMIGLFAGGLCMVAWLRYQEQGEKWWLFAAATALALGLTSSPLFYGLLLTLGLAYLAQARLGPPIFYTEQLDDEEQVVYAPAPTNWPNRDEWRTTLILLGATLLGLSTLFLWYLPGLGVTASLPVMWLRQISFQGELLQWVEPILALGRYELILLLFGAAAILWSTWQGQPFPTFFIYWFTGILLLIFIQRGNLDNVLLLTLPGYLLVGLFFNHIWSIPAPNWRWPLAGLLFLLGLMAYINLNYYSRVAAANADLQTNLIRTIVLIVLGLATIIYLARFSPMMVAQGVMAGILPLLLLFTWGTTWWLTQQAANDPRERWVREGTDDDIPLLAQLSQELALQATNSQFDLTVYSTVDSPVLRWYMRNFSGYEVGEALPDELTTDLVITAADSDAAAPATYLVSEYGLLRQGLGTQEAEYQGDFFATLRWWFFHESPMPINEQKINVWLRTDLAR